MITPLKLRAAVLRARAEGRTHEEVAALLGIGRATVNRIFRLHRETNSLEPRPRGGGNVSPIDNAVAQLLAAIVAETPDATVDELADPTGRFRAWSSRPDAPGLPALRAPLVRCHDHSLWCLSTVV